MAATELRRDADGDGAADVAGREVVDVVVFGDDEALRSRSASTAVELQDRPSAARARSPSRTCSEPRSRALSRRARHGRSGRGPDRTRRTRRRRTPRPRRGTPARARGRSSSSRAADAGDRARAGAAAATRRSDARRSATRSPSSSACSSSWSGPVPFIRATYCATRVRPAGSSAGYANCAASRDASSPTSVPSTGTSCPRRSSAGDLFEVLVGRRGERRSRCRPTSWLQDRAVQPWS